MKGKAKMERGDRRHAACSEIFGQERCDALADGTAEDVYFVKTKDVVDDAPTLADKFFDEATDEELNPYFDPDAAQRVVERCAARRKEISEGVASLFGSVSWPT